MQSGGNRRLSQHNGVVVRAKTSGGASLTLAVALEDIMCIKRSILAPAVLALGSLGIVAGSAAPVIASSASASALVASSASPSAIGQLG